MRTSGACQGGAHWKLKASAEDGRIEVEGEIDSNRAGQTWNWTLTHNGTRGRQGHAQDRRRQRFLRGTPASPATGAGTDTFVFNARGPARSRSAAAPSGSEQPPAVTAGIIAA